MLNNKSVTVCVQDRSCRTFVSSAVSLMFRIPFPYLRIYALKVVFCWRVKLWCYCTMRVHLNKPVSTSASHTPVQRPAYRYSAPTPGTSSHSPVQQPTHRYSIPLTGTASHQPVQCPTHCYSIPPNDTTSHPSVRHPTHRYGIPPIGTVQRFTVQPKQWALR